MITAVEVYIGWVEQLEGKQDEDALDGVLATVDKVTVEEVRVAKSRKTIQLKDAVQVIQLSMKVTDDGQSCVYIYTHDIGEGLKQRLHPGQEFHDILASEETVVFKMVHHCSYKVESNATRKTRRTVFFNHSRGITLDLRHSLQRLLYLFICDLQLLIGSIGVHELTFFLVVEEVPCMPHAHLLRTESTHHAAEYTL